MQLRQFLWIFLRCAHVTVNGMNRNVRTVCSILWNCYDFFFSYHIIYLPETIASSPGSLSCLNNIFYSASASAVSAVCLSCVICLCIVCTVICCFGISIFCCCIVRCSKRNQLLLLYEPHTDLLLLRFFQDLRSDSQHCRNHRMPQTEISRNLHHHQPYHC